MKANSIRLTGRQYAVCLARGPMALEPVCLRGGDSILFLLVHTERHPFRGDMARVINFILENHFSHHSSLPHYSCRSRLRPLIVAMEDEAG